MADKNPKKSFREQRLSIAAATVQEVHFQDTYPNYFYIANNSALNMYVSISPAVSATLFDYIVPPFATKLWARADGTNQIFIANVSSTTAIAATLQSFENDFNPSNLPQTQEIVGASASGLLGVIEVTAIDSALPAGTNALGLVGLDREIPVGTQHLGQVALDASLPAGSNHMGQVASGGSALTNNCVLHRLIAAGTTNATSVKASAGRLHWGLIDNLSASIRYLKFYNKASAPTVGTDTPVMTITLKANSQTVLGIPDLGLVFATGIAYAITGALADADTTAITAADVVVNLEYA